MLDLQDAQVYSPATTTKANGSTDPQAKAAERTRSPHDEHLPTPEEIRQACLQIQSGWTEAERRRRAGMTGVRSRSGYSVSVPVGQVWLPMSVARSYCNH